MQGFADITRPLECGYFFLVPEGMEKEVYMKKMYEDYIFPALARERDAQPRAAGDPTPRGLFFMDGDHGPLQAINSLKDLLHQLLIDAVKSAAGASGIQQANDVMRAFMLLRALLKSWSYMYNEDVYQGAVELPYVGLVMDRVKAVCTASSFNGKRRLLKKFLIMGPILLPSAFNVPCIMKGWRVCGLWPYSLRTILQQCSTILTDDDYDKFLKALPEFTLHGINNGDIAEELFDKHGIAMRKEIGNVQNSKRALILNHEKVRAQNLAYHEAKVAEEAAADDRRQAKAAVAAAKAVRDAMTDEQKADEAKALATAKGEKMAAQKAATIARAQAKKVAEKQVRAEAKLKKQSEDAAQAASSAAAAPATAPAAAPSRKRPAAGGTPVVAESKKPAKFKCASPFCKVPTGAPESWSMCSTCEEHPTQGWFCLAPACMSMLAFHESTH